MILLLNFKTYKEGTGKNAVKLAKMCKEVARRKQVKAIIAPQVVDICTVNKILPTISQHVDYQEQGKYTGYLLPEELKADKAIGSLINHSEHKLRINEVKKTILRCKKLKLKTFVCAASLAEVKKIIRFKPDYLAYEVPELIGTGKSITKVKAPSVAKFVKMLKGKKIIPLCGSGISEKEDVQAALRLGCKGVLISSAFVKARNPKKKLLSML